MTIRNILLVILVVAGTFWRLIGTQPRGANDFPYSYSDYVTEGFDIPQLWSTRGNGMGELKVSTLWGWPLDFMYGLGSKAGIDFAVLFRLLGIIPIVLIGLWGSRRLLEYYGVGSRAALLGSLFFVLNSYLILLIDGGQLSVALAYSWFPIAFLEFVKSISGKLRRRLFGVLTVGILGIFDLRFVYMLFLVLGLRFIYDFVLCKRLDRIKMVGSWLLSFVLSGLFIVAINLYWILPALMAKTGIVPESYSVVSDFFSLGSANLGNALLMLQPHWYTNVFGQTTPLLYEFLLLPILAFAAPILVTKNKQLGFWLTVALLSAFLVKGELAPFSQIYSFLLHYVPGFFIFRDATKFFFPLTIAYMVLISTTLDFIFEKTKVAQRGKALVVIGFVSYLVILARPIWLNKMTGLFANPVYSNEQLAFAQVVSQDRSFGRIFWLPAKPVLGYASGIHPAVDTQSLIAKRPFAAAISGGYETSNFVRSPYMSMLFDITGIGYVVYPYPDARREETKADDIDYYSWFLTKIAGFPWLNVVDSKLPVPVFTTVSHQDKFFVAGNTAFLIGSDDVYADLATIPGFSLANNALVFAEESTSQIDARINFSNSTVLVWEKEKLDVAVNLAADKIFVFPANRLTVAPNSQGWWKSDTANLISWRAFLQTKYGLDNQDFDYGGGWAVAEGNKAMEIQLPGLSNRTLLARVMTSSRGGKVTFSQGDKLLGAIDTSMPSGRSSNTEEKYEKASVRWYKVGNNLDLTTPITVSTSGDINVINGFISVPTANLDEAELKVDDMITGGEIVFLDDLKLSEKANLLAKPTAGATLTYGTISPTHYQIDVRGLSKPGTLVFSDSFNSMWVLNDKASTKLYSFINGFPIDQDGVYNVYLYPQKWVVPGLIASALALLVLALAAKIAV